MRHSEEIEADLARYYPRDKDQLSEWYSGRLSLRRLWVLVHGLPRDSSVYERVNGVEESNWSPVVEGLASVVDAVREMDYHLSAGLGAKGLTPPRRVPRPKGLINDGKDPRVRPSRD